MIETTLYLVVIFVSIILFIKYVKQDPDSELKCVISHVDGNTYCVRERAKLQMVADLLARITKKMNDLVNHLKNKYPENDIVTRLANGFNPQKIYETLPTSKHVAYSQNKGKKLAFCVTKQKEGNDLIDENTLTFVALHEISHIGTETIGHKKDFWKNFKFILQEAKEYGIYNPERYKESPKDYCGIKITDNPYFDLKE
jgi:hypothetical protein